MLLNSVFLVSALLIISSIPLNAEYTVVNVVTGDKLLLKNTTNGQLQEVSLKCINEPTILFWQASSKLNLIAKAPIGSKVVLENITDEPGLYSSTKTADIYTSSSVTSLSAQQVQDGMATSKRTADCENITALEKKAYDSNKGAWLDPIYKTRFAP